MPSDRVQQFGQALAALLPPGDAFPRVDGSTWMAVIRWLAGMFGELFDWQAQATLEWQPHATRTRLAEWEAALGLPDGCWAATLTTEQRRAIVLARLRGFSGAYADSSPAAPGAIEDYLAALGYTATVSSNRPFRVGRDRVGQPLGANGILHVSMAAAHAGDETALRCALQPVVPARFEIHFEFV